MQIMPKKLVAPFVGLLAMTAPSMTALADGSEPTPVTVNASIASKTFSLGEPIVVHCQIQNSGNFPVHPDLSDEKHQFLEDGGTKWFTISLRDASGTMVPAIPFIPAPYEGALVSGPTIAPGGVYRSDIVANEWLSIPHAGKYTLSLTFLPYFSADTDHYLPQSDTRDTFSVPITITPADAPYLHSTALSLRTQIMQCRDEDQQQKLLDALFSLPESAGLKEWDTLFSDKTISRRLRGMTLENISCLHTPAAVDLLAKACWGADQFIDADDTDAKSKIVLYLSDMYIHGDRGLKQHINKVLAFYDQHFSAPLIRLD